MAFRKADLLLPLCLVSAILLNVYAAVDPTGVYRRYLEKLAPMTPPVAAMATALADGVYPWSTQQANGPAPQPTPQPRPEPTPEPEPAPVPEPEPEPEPQPQPEPGPAPVPEPDSRFTQVDASYFDDAVFIGDSHTDGFMDYAGLPNAHYLCHTGLTVWSAAEDAAFPGGQTLAQALSGKHYGKIYMTDRGIWVAKQVDRELKTILTHFPPVGEPLSEEERFTAALAMTSALPERIFTGEYERLFGSDAEKTETEKK